MVRRIVLGVLFGLFFVGMMPMLTLWAMQIWTLFTLPAKLDALEPPPEQVVGGRSEMTAMIEPGPPDPGPEPETAPAPEYLDDRGRRLADRTRALILSPERLSTHRRVALDLQLDPVGLLAPAEKLPDGAVRDVFVEARAAGVLGEFCAMVDEILAERCVVETYRTRKTRVDETEAATPAPPPEPVLPYRLTATLLFVPSDPVGTLPAGPVLVAETRAAELLHRPLDGFGLEGQAAALRVVLQEAKSACDTLRAGFGNCTIALVSLRVFDRDEPTARGRAEWIVLGLETGSPEP